MHFYDIIRFSICKAFLRNIYFLFYVDKLPKLWCTDMNSLRLKTLQQDPYCRLWNCNFYIIFSAVGGSFGIFPAEPSAVLFSLHNVIRPKHAKCCTFQKVFFKKSFGRHGRSSGWRAYIGTRIDAHVGISAGAQTGKHIDIRVGSPVGGYSDT